MVCHTFLSCWIVCFCTYVYHVIKTNKCRIVTHLFSHWRLCDVDKPKADLRESNSNGIATQYGRCLLRDTYLGLDIRHKICHTLNRLWIWSAQSDMRFKCRVFISFPFFISFYNKNALCDILLVVLNITYMFAMLTQHGLFDPVCGIRLIYSGISLILANNNDAVEYKHYTTQAIRGSIQFQGLF